MPHIATRHNEAALVALQEAGKRIYSISKLNTIDNCPYEAYLKYIKKTKGQPGVYGILGTRVHDALEAIMTGKATKADLLPALDDELNNLKVLGLDFPKDFRGGTAIRDNWISDMTHFCRNFEKPKGKFLTEEFFLYKLDNDHYLQGYIDLIRMNDDGSISIIDWKTSSDFRKDDLMHHGRQLVLYALAKQQQGFDVRDIQWIMLKYAEVSYRGKARSNAKTETEIKKVINRGKLVRELRSAIESKFPECGILPLDGEFYMEEALRNNSLDGLPAELRGQFTLKPYVRSYTQTVLNCEETLDYIRRMIDAFESRSADEAEWQPKSFFDAKGKEDTFYCNVLCDYRLCCSHIRKHNDLRVLMKTLDDDLF